MRSKSHVRLYVEIEISREQRWILHEQTSLHEKCIVPTVRAKVFRPIKVSSSWVCSILRHKYKQRVIQKLPSTLELSPLFCTLWHATTTTSAQASPLWKPLSDHSTTIMIATMTSLAFFSLFLELSRELQLHICLPPSGTVQASTTGPKLPKPKCRCLLTLQIPNWTTKRSQFLGILDCVE